MVEKISVIIPTKDTPKYLDECITSILNQKNDYDIEVILGIDNCEKTLNHIKNNKLYSNIDVYYFYENVGPYIIKNNLIDIKADGSFRLNLDYFDYQNGGMLTSERFHQLFGGAPRLPESRITKKEMDLAASIQSVTEEIMIKLAKYVRDLTGASNLCLAGGVALNCVANGKILRENIFDGIWIQPAAGDAGGAAERGITGSVLSKAHGR
jgi:glycosyltransferase involved in cell wall biosynthesis